MPDDKLLKHAGSPKAKGYGESGASVTRRALKSFLPRSGSPNEDINWNNFTLRQRGRLLYMASPVAASAVNTNRTKVVGPGLTLKCAVEREILGLSAETAKAWQKKTEVEFAMWSGRKENFDAIGVNNFESMQQQALMAWLMSGDVFGLFKRYPATPVNPYTLRLHLIEADRVSTPSAFGAGIVYPGGIIGGITDGMNPNNGHKIYDGVEVSKEGAIVAYHIRNTYPFQVWAEPTVWTRVEAYGAKTGMPNILQIMNSERPDQYRGVTYLAQVIEPLLQLRRFTESTLTAALIQSFLTAWIKTTTDPSGIPFEEVGAGDVAGIQVEDPAGISRGKNEYEMGQGTVIHLEPGEDVTFGNPNIPATSFEAFTKTMCRTVGAALELPYDVLIKEFNSSYSAARGALLEAWEAFRMRREWFTDDFCRPVYEAWLAEAVALGRIKAPGFFDDPLIRAAWCGARWIGPVQGQINPMHEVRAALMTADRGIKTYEQVTRELGGGDWEDNVEQLKRENVQLREAGGGNVTAPAGRAEGEPGSVNSV